MRTVNIHPGTVMARSHESPAIASEQFFTVAVHLPSGDSIVPNVRPWTLEFVDHGLLTRPYPLSAQVLCIEVGQDWRFIFPNQSPNTGPC